MKVRDLVKNFPKKVKGEGCISRSIGIIERVGLMVMLLLRGKVG